MTVYDVTDRLPDGRERVHGTGLTLSDAIEASHAPELWAVTLVQRRAGDLPTGRINYAEEAK